MKYSAAFIIIFVFFCVRGKSQFKNLELFKEHKFHMEYNLGVAGNFIDPKTKNYYNNYFLISIGAAVYLKKFKLSYSFNPVSISKVKKDFISKDGDHVQSYNRGFWNTHGNYWINLLRHDLNLGYEIQLKNNWSITPTTGVAITSLKLVNDSAHSGKYTAERFYGVNAGFSARKYFFISNSTGFFVGLSACYFISNIKDQFPELGNSFYSVSIHCGFKFHPNGKGLGLILESLLKRS